MLFPYGPRPNRHKTGSPFGRLGFAPEPGFSLSGPLVDGGSVRISGSGFGTKPNGAAPLYFYELGNGVRTLDPRSRGTHADTWESNCSLQTDQVAPNRSKSLRYTFYMDGVGHSALSGDAGFSDAHDIGAVPDHYLFTRMRINADGTDLFAGLATYNIKGQRVWAPADNDPRQNISGPRMGSPDAAPGGPRLKIENMTATDTFAAGDEANLFGFRKDEWITDEWQSHTGGIDVVDSTWRFYRNGVAIDHEFLASTSFVGRKTPDQEDFCNNVFHYQEQFSGDPGFQIYWWLDFWYVEDSWHRILLSEEPTYDAGTITPTVVYNREPQIPTAWADTEIDMDLRFGIFGIPVGKYLYVTSGAGVGQKVGQFIAL